MGLLGLNQSKLQIKRRSSSLPQKSREREEIKVLRLHEQKSSDFGCQTVGIEGLFQTHYHKKGQ